MLKISKIITYVLIIFMYMNVSYINAQNVLDEKNYVTDNGTIKINDDCVIIFDDVKFYPWSYNSILNELDNTYIESYSNRYKNIIVTIIFDEFKKPDYIKILIDGDIKYYNIKKKSIYGN